jgi:hypothetical protein
MSSSTIAATRIVVERYDESLKQIAQLKRENFALKEIIRINEIKALNLIEHYKTEIDTQTKLATSLQDELRAREHFELLKQHRNFRDQCTWIEEEELQSKENELMAVIYALEDEIQALRDDQQKRARDFERKALENEANVKQSFLQDIDSFRSQLSSSVCREVRGALADTVADNQRLAIEFRLLLQEMEKIQMSRDEKDRELSRTKRELELLKHTHQLMTSRLKRQLSREQDRCTAPTPSNQLESETSETKMMPVVAKIKLKPASEITSRNAYFSAGEISNNDKTYLQNFP